MTETPNLHLTKDARNDHYSVDRVNANSDRIDGFAGETAASLSDLDERVEALEEGGVPADAYTKAETDTLLAAKADQSDLSALAATVAGKQDEISDLAAIRSGAASGATAVQPDALATSLLGKVDKEAGKSLSSNDYTTAEKQKLAGLSNYNDAEIRSMISEKQDVIEDLSDIRSGAGAGSTAVQPADMATALAGKQDTISDLSTIRAGASAGATAVQPGELSTALNGKVDKMTGYGLSSNDYTTSEKQKLAGLSNYDDTEVRGLISEKQDTISDLSTIRSGASAGATAVQAIKINGTTQTKTDGTVNLPAYPTTLPASDTVSTYSSTGTAPVNGKAVKAALDTLDVSSVGGAGKYINAISETNGKIVATPTAFDTTLSSSSTNNNAPTSKAIYDDQQRQDKEIAVIANAGEKNLLRFRSDITSSSTGNVYAKINSDGTVSVGLTSGTTATAQLVFILGSITDYRDRKLILSGCPAGGNYQSGYALYVSDNNSTAQVDTGSGATLPIVTGVTSSVVELMVRSGTAISSELTFRPMVRNASITDSTFVPFALSNPTITSALVNQVDGGAKNKLHITQIGSSDSNVGTKVTSQGVEYEIQSDGTITAYRKTSSSSGAYIFLYENGSVKDVSEFFDGQHFWSGNPSQYPSTVSVWYKIGSGSNVTMPNGTILPNANGASVRIGFQISSSASPTQSDPIVFKPMICSVSDGQVSRKFVPYCPTMQELYQMILALQNGGA